MLKLAEIGHYGMGGFQLFPFYEGCGALGRKHHLITAIHRAFAAVAALGLRC